MGSKSLTEDAPTWQPATVGKKEDGSVGTCLLVVGEGWVEGAIQAAEGTLRGDCWGDFGDDPCCRMAIPVTGGDWGAWKE